MGGGVMRAAASRVIGFVPAFGGFGGVLRGSQSVPKPEYQGPFTATKRPDSAIAAAGSIAGGSVVAEKASSGVGDWEFAGVVEDAVSFGGSSVDSLPRVVFGGAPSFDEAKEATLELIAAVDMTLPSENGTVPGHQEARLPLLMGSESITTRASTEVATANAVPKYAVQAFRLLSENPAAQTVVTSIASDPNVWNAVLQNSAFVDYLESHRADATSTDVDVRLNQHMGIEKFTDAESEASFTGLSESSESRTSIAEIFQNIKLTVMDMVNHVSSCFQHVFGLPNEKPTDEISSGTPSFIETTTLNASIMGLAIMVISMVVLKRA